MQRTYTIPDPHESPFSCLLRHARGCWGPILTRIPTGPGCNRSDESANQWALQYSIVTNLILISWTERLFLVTHCLSALYKGPFQQSNSLCWVKGPVVRAQASRTSCSFFSFLTLGGWIFLAEMQFVNYNPAESNFILVQAELDIYTLAFHILAISLCTGMALNCLRSLCMEVRWNRECLLSTFKPSLLLFYFNKFIINFSFCFYWSDVHNQEIHIWTSG
jgi:hypothetical protein